MKWGTHFFNQRVISNPLIRDAMDFVKREDFLPLEKRYLADEDHPIEIRHGQTNSQPYTVAFMLNLLDPRPGQRILDIGSGSGWTSTILAWIVSYPSSFRVKRSEIEKSHSGSFRAYNEVSPLGSRLGRDDDSKGKVYAIERIQELATFGEENADKYGFVQSGVLKFIHSDGSLGLPEHAPYDRILASAAFQQFPTHLVNQLSREGMLVIPVEGTQTNDIIKVVKDREGNVTKRVFPGFVFVPMIINKR